MSSSHSHLLLCFPLKMRHPYLPLKQRQPKRAPGATMLMLSGALTSPSHCKEAAPCDSHAAPPLFPRYSPAFHASPHFCVQVGKKERKEKKETRPILFTSPSALMDETDIMDLTHQKARKRPRPISSVDESVHSSLKRLPIRAAECREPSLMFAVRGEPVPAASLKQNDHSVTSSPNTVMPAQVKT